MPVFELAYGFGLSWRMPDADRFGFVFIDDGRRAFRVDDDGRTAVYEFDRFIPAGDVFITDYAVNYDGRGIRVLIEDIAWFSFEDVMISMTELDLVASLSAVERGIARAGITGGDDVFHGAERGDRIHGGAGRDTIMGYAGRDRLFGDAGDDEVFGGRHDDRLEGGGGRDWLSAWHGADSLFGGPGADDLDGGRGPDRLSGGGGRDWLAGRRGDDVLSGGRGNDTLKGHAGHDRIAAGPGEDTLRGGRGEDTLSGGARDDLLVGGRGDDTLTGGGGFDVHVFSGRFGEDTVTDFDLQRDLIDLAGVRGRPDFDDLWIRDTSRGAAIVVNGGEILLEGVREAELTPEMFVF